MPEKLSLGAETLDTFYKDNRILVTGVAGVKGSWLALKLLGLGSKVRGIDVKAPPPRSNFNLSGLQDQIEFCVGDIADLGFMQQAMTGVNAVFHLAAVALVGRARRMPLETYRTNVLGTATVLECLRASESVRHAVMITTDKVYQATTSRLPPTEQDRLLGRGPYAVSKTCAELVIADYCQSELRPAHQSIAIGRAGNVLIGGDFNSSRLTDGAGRIFVDCYEALMQKQSPTIYSPLHRRPYTYGLDVIAGYTRLMAALSCRTLHGEAFNFGPRDRYGIENQRLASLICQSWNIDVAWQSGAPRDEPVEDQYLDSTKASEVLGWKPAYSVGEAVQDTTMWYREWLSRGCVLDRGGMRDFNQFLIQRHERAAKQRLNPWALTKQAGA